jgi:hypothetical protein
VEALLEAARRRADASEMAHRPRVDVSPRFLDAGVVAFGLPRTVAVALENTGAVDAAFYYVAPPGPAGGADDKSAGGRAAWGDEEPPLCPPWLRLLPEEGTVEAGGRGSGV